jgi:hypothetical protein
MNPVHAPKILCLAALALLAGCGDLHYRHNIPLDPSFGNATRHNQAAHAIDLDPAWAKDTDLSTDGKRALKAMERYHGGQEKQVEKVETKGN